MSATAIPHSKRQMRDQRKTERRDAILKAARTVFAKSGFDGATVAGIAQEAGVASGTVYLYYKSKTDLFAALNALLYQLINEAMAETNAPPDLRGGTRARIRAVFAVGGRHRDLLRLVFLNPDPRAKVARRIKRTDEERLRPLEQLLRTAIDAGTVRRADPVLLARLTNGLVITALYQCFIQSDGRDAQSYEETVTEMIVGGLTPR